MTWLVTVPTYGRKPLLLKRTLPMLLDGGVDPERIIVYAGDQDTYGLPTGVRLERAPVGLAPARNHITETLPEGQEYVACDDDMHRIVRLEDGKISTVTDLSALFDEAFRLAHAGRVTLWGGSPASNPYFMRPERSPGLWFCDGTFWGCINTRAITISRSAKEDYERTLLHYDHAGATLRLRDISFVSDPLRTTPGGMQLESHTRKEDEDEAVRYLHSRWPSLVHDKPGRGGYPEIALRRPAKGRP